MNKVKKFFKSNIKLFVGIIIGLIISGTGVYAASILFGSDQVGYDNTTSGMAATDVQSALDELKGLADNCPSVYTANVVVSHGSVTGDSSVQVLPGGQATFTVNKSSGYTCTPTVSCTNGQTATLSDSTLTTGALSGNTTCTVTFIKPDVTYTEETINSACTFDMEHSTDRDHYFCCSNSTPVFDSDTGFYTMSGTLTFPTNARYKNCVGFEWGTSAGASCSGRYTSWSYVSSAVSNITYTSQTGTCYAYLGGEEETDSYQIPYSSSNTTAHKFKWTGTLHRRVAIESCPS